MATPTPRGLRRLDTIDPYRLVNDWNEAENATDAALTAVETGAIAYADQVGRDTLEAAKAAALTTAKAEAASATQTLRADLVRPSPNLVDPQAADVVADAYVAADTGAPIYSAYYDATGFLPVAGGQKYTAGPEVFRITWYKSDKSYIGFPAGYADNSVRANPITVTAPTSAAYARVSVTKGRLPGVMMVKGSTLPSTYVPSTEGSMAPDLAALVGQAAEKKAAAAAATVDARVDNVVADVWRTSPQMFDPAVSKADTALNLSTGADATLAGYTATGYMPVTAGQTYTLSNPRHIVWYNTNKIKLSHVDNATSAALTATAPAGAVYLRAGFSTTYKPSFMVNAGALQPWEAYKARTLSATMASQIKAATGGAVKVVRQGQDVTITRTIGGNTLTERAVLRDTKNNLAFQFGTVSWNGVALTHATDDITPIRTQMGTVGGNHGMPYVRRFSNPDGKTAADLGSVWSDGTNQWTLLALEADGRLVLGGPPITNSAGVTIVNNTTPAAPLTHVSGATKTGTIDHATVSGTQLWPYVARQAVRLFVDGQEVTTDGTIGGATVEIRETYDILDYADLVAEARAHTGTPIDGLDVTGAVQVQNTYTWRPGGSCKITTELTELRPTNLAACGFVQAQAHDLAGDRRVRHIPGVGVVGGADWTAGVDTAAWSSDAIVKQADLTTGHAPVVDLERVITGTTTLVGFAIGFIPHTRVAESDSPVRLAKSPANLWDLRSTDKHYPTAITSAPAGWGHIRAVGFRAYLAGGDADRVAAQATAPAAWATLATATGLGGAA